MQDQCGNFAFTVLCHFLWTLWIRNEVTSNNIWRFPVSLCGKMSREYVITLGKYYKDYNALLAKRFMGN